MSHRNAPAGCLATVERDPYALPPLNAQQIELLSNLAAAIYDEGMDSSIRVLRRAALRKVTEITAEEARAFLQAVGSSRPPAKPAQRKGRSQQ